MGNSENSGKKKLFESASDFDRENVQKNNNLIFSSEKGISFDYKNNHLLEKKMMNYTEGLNVQQPIKYRGISANKTGLKIFENEPEKIFDKNPLTLKNPLFDKNDNKLQNNTYTHQTFEKRRNFMSVDHKNIFPESENWMKNLASSRITSQKASLLINLNDVHTINSTQSIPEEKLNKKSDPFNQNYAIKIFAPEKTSKNVQNRFSSEHISANSNKSLSNPSINKFIQENKHSSQILIPKDINPFLEKTNVENQQKFPSQENQLLQSNRRLPTLNGSNQTGTNQSSLQYLDIKNNPKQNNFFPKQKESFFGKMNEKNTIIVQKSAESLNSDNSVDSIPSSNEMPKEKPFQPDDQILNHKISLFNDQLVQNRPYIPSIQENKFENSFLRKTLSKQNNQFLQPINELGTPSKVSFSKEALPQRVSIFAIQQNPKFNIDMKYTYVPVPIVSKRLTQFRSKIDEKRYNPRDQFTIDSLAQQSCNYTNSLSKSRQADQSNLDVDNILREAERVAPLSRFSRNAKIIWSSNRTEPNQIDNEHYDGSYKNGVRDGYGMLVVPDKFIYKGCFKEGRFHGDGIMIYEDKTKYDGDFVEGKRQGFGTLFAENGNPLRSGYWQNDVFVNKK